MASLGPKIVLMSNSQKKRQTIVSKNYACAIDAKSMTHEYPKMFTSSWPVARHT